MRSKDRFRNLISGAGLPDPDEVHKDTRTGELTFMWHEQRLSVVVGPDGEIRDVPELEPEDA